MRWASRKKMSRLVEVHSILVIPPKILWQHEGKNATCLTEITIIFEMCRNYVGVCVVLQNHLIVDGQAFINMTAFCSCWKWLSSWTKGPKKWAQAELNLIPQVFYHASGLQSSRAVSGRIEFIVKHVEILVSAVHWNLSKTAFRAVRAKEGRWKLAHSGLFVHWMALVFNVTVAARQSNLRLVKTTCWVWAGLISQERFRKLVWFTCDSVKRRWMACRASRLQKNNHKPRDLRAPRNRPFGGHCFCRFCWALVEMIIDNERLCINCRKS